MDSDGAAFEGEARLAIDAEQSTRQSRRYGSQAGYKAAMTVGGAEVEGDPSESSALLNTSGGGDGERQHSPPAWHGDLDFEGLPWWRRPSVAWLLFPFLLYATTFGGTIVPTINLMKELICRDLLRERAAADPNYPLPNIVPGDDNEVCNSDNEVQAATAVFILYTQVIGGLLAAITCPKLGALSDRYGRLRMLIVTGFGSLVKDVFIIAITKNPDVFSINWILIAYGIDGLMGSFPAGMAIVHAYASDCTPPNRRATVFGWFHACLFTGVAVGPIISGYIVEWTGALVNLFYVATVAHVFYLAFLGFVAPESLSRKRRFDAQVRKTRMDAMVAELHVKGYQAAAHGGEIGILAAAALTLSLWWQRHNIFAPLKILCPTGPGTSWALRRNLLILSTVDTIIFGTAIGSMTVVVMYLGHAFNWRNLETSQYVSIVNMSRVTCLLVVLPVVQRLVRGRGGSSSSSSSGNSAEEDEAELKQRESGCDGLDLALIRTSIVFDTLGYVGYAAAPTGGWITASGILASIGALGSPTMQSALTKHVPPETVGQLLGATGLLHALARVVAPAVFNYIYASTVVIDRPATVFVVLACCFAFAFVVSWGVKAGVYYDAKAVEEEIDRASRRDAAAQEQGQQTEEEALI